MRCFKFGEILLPRKDISISDWAVIACDQYTSDRSYWDALESSVSGPSALRLIFPECYLGENDERRIADIVAAGKDYEQSGVFRPVDGTVLVRRRTAYGNERLGLMCLVRLADYSAVPGKKALIRATEGLVPSRIPPRKEIRRRLDFELPHVMLLIDDERRSVIEPLAKNASEVLYDGDLSARGGHITGYRVEDTRGTEAALDALLEDSERKYGEQLLFLVGDGNHSLATAKACADENEPLSEYALVEIVNIYDEGLGFEPIHRAVFDVDGDDFLAALNGVLEGEKGSTTVFCSDRAVTVPFPEDPAGGVELVQNFLDRYIEEKGGRVDYIHGEDDLKKICASGQAVGILMHAMDKSRFFGDVLRRGAFPRKAFSMGEADEKRYYVEARRIKSK